MNPITLAQTVEERYQSYLKTMFYFRDPVLRESFAQALAAGHLSNGPFLEATPIFKKGDTPRELFTQLLGTVPDKGFLDAIEGERPLHLHQHRAIERVAQGHNVIVATGTGSGKTEAFLYPILLHLYREHQAGKLGAGVRALILYPMNALANDQRDRLDAICKNLERVHSSFGFTFGQYIGETPEGASITRRGGNTILGELKTRAEIRDTPPHILLTNYSMLEYLLIRPNDHPLFDARSAPHWTFLVLDEAHLYRGARGIEMSMLIRRLKQRLREGGRVGEFRCIATSATLASQDDDKRTVADFASKLFDEPFTEQDVIFGETQVVELQDARAAKLCRLITGNPLLVQEIADDVFDDIPTEGRIQDLTAQMEALTQTRDLLNTAPVLSARYHLFLRSLEGAYIQFLPQKRILLEKSLGDASAAIFEIALCRECGQHYLVAPKDFKRGKLTEAIRDPSHEQFGATFFRPIENENEAADIAGDASPAAQDIYSLCVRCGELAKDKPSCVHTDWIQVVKEESNVDDSKADQIKRCGACGYNAAGRDPVREIVHGTDGPHSVIATTLYQNLERKKILAFADGRQEAAFFAWYLDKSYHEILNRNLLLQIALNFGEFPPNGISLATLADHAMQKFHDVFQESESDDDATVRKNIWRALYREFITEEQRISLEGVGLIRWSLEFPKWFQVPEILRQPPWSLTEAEARDLIVLLLNTMRANYAVELKCKDNVALTWQDLYEDRNQKRFCIGEPGKQKNVVSWNGKQGSRTRLLEKFTKSKIDTATIDLTLRQIWDALTPQQSAPVLELIDGARRLNPDWWRMHLVSDQDKLYECTVCGRLETINLRGFCVRRGCPGTLQEIFHSELEDNHYRTLYQDTLPNSLVVEEHTAQLDNNKAREFQQRFKENKINVLSCSTTFELGVDLGDLDTTFLRNVPPESFNYAQRVGRVGRRLGRPGFVITYCRRNSHDLYHFNNPYRILRGQTQPPTISLCNEKIITRHVAAIALSAFFREYPNRFERVTGLCENIPAPSGVRELKTFLQQRRGKVELALRNIVPRDVEDKVGLNDGTWVEKIVGEQSRFAEAEAELSSDYNEVVELRENAAKNFDPQQMGWANRRLDTIAKEDVLSFLSRKAIIPKYGFPVDVVELDTHRTTNAESSTVSLQRDLSIAISEFAPSSELVANKKTWKSYGLKKVVSKEWERWWYARCPIHARFERKHYAQGAQRPTFQKCCNKMSVTLEYIEPRFGFVTENINPKDPKGRPIRVFTTRPYFVGFKDGQNKKGQSLNSVIHVTQVSPGIMVVVCEGRHGSGFYICDICGAGFQSLKEFAKGHKTPYGQVCSARADKPRAVMLGHELLTDVLKLQFQLPPVNIHDSIWLAFSLAYALVEGAAEHLDVPSTDLSATIAYAENQTIPPIVLFDNVPGGAGLVARLENTDTLKTALEAARERVSGECGCRAQDSCYGCLRNYRNQFAHQNLQRGAALQYLEAVLANW